MFRKGNDLVTPCGKPRVLIAAVVLTVFYGLPRLAWDTYQDRKAARS